MSKVWFITGAGSGIGAGTAKAALKASDRVVATGRNVQKVRDALREVAGDDLYVLPLDVSDEAQVTMAVDQAVKKFGRIDVVLNTAGYSLLGNFEELGTQEIERQFATLKSTGRSSTTGPRRRRRLSRSPSPGHRVDHPRRRCALHLDPRPAAHPGPRGHHVHARQWPDGHSGHRFGRRLRSRGGRARSPSPE